MSQTTVKPENSRRLPDVEIFAPFVSVAHQYVIAAAKRRVGLGPGDA